MNDLRKHARACSRFPVGSAALRFHGMPARRRPQGRSYSARGGYSGAAKLLLASAFLVFGCGASNDGIVEEIFDRTYQVGANATLSVKNTDGAIRVYGAETEQIRIQAVKRAYSKERLDAIAIAVTARGNALAIDTIYPPTPKRWSLRDRSGTVDYIIVVPQACKISHLELANGEVAIEGIREGSAIARLANGWFVSKDCFGSDLRLSVATGRLELIYGWWEEGSPAVWAEIAQGNLRAVFAPESSFQLDAATAKGNLLNRFGRKGRARGGSSQAMKTSFGAEQGPRLTLRATNGNITVEPAY